MKSSKGDKYLYGINLNDKRVMGLSQGDNLIFKETEKTVSGTSVNITDTKNDTASVDWECNSTQATTGYGLPSTYTQVEYIESTGTQYINTQEYTNINNRIVCDLALTLNNSAVVNYSGAVYKESKGWVAIGSYGLNALVGYFCNATRDGVTIPFDTNFHLYDIKNGLQKIDNNSTAISASSIPTTLQMYLFKSSNDFLGNYANQQKIKYCKIYNGTTLVRNLIPCYKKSDNVIGMYDTVTGSFITNTGTGTFLKGPDLTIPNANFPQDVYNSGDGGSITITSSNGTTTDTKIISSPDGYAGGSLPNGVKDTATTKYIGIATFTGRSITISDFKSNGSFRCTHGGSISGQTLTLTSATTDTVTVYYELETPITISNTLPTISSYITSDTITTTNFVKPDLTVKYLEI